MQTPQEFEIVPEAATSIHCPSCTKVEEAPIVDNLVRIIIGAAVDGGGLDCQAIASKLLNFGSNGASAMAGCRTGVSTQIVEKYVPFCTP